MTTFAATGHVPWSLNTPEMRLRPRLGLNLIFGVFRTQETCLVTVVCKCRSLSLREGELTAFPKPISWIWWATSRWGKDGKGREGKGLETTRPEINIWLQRWLHFGSWVYVVCSAVNRLTVTLSAVLLAFEPPDAHFVIIKHLLFCCIESRRPSVVLLRCSSSAAGGRSWLCLQYWMSVWWPGQWSRAVWTQPSQCVGDHKVRNDAATTHPFVKVVFASDWWCAIFNGYIIYCLYNQASAASLQFARIAYWLFFGWT